MKTHEELKRMLEFLGPNILYLDVDSTLFPMLSMIQIQQWQQRIFKIYMVDGEKIIHEFATHDMRICVNMIYGFDKNSEWKIVQTKAWG